MLDLTKPVQTRSGRPVRLLVTDLKSPYPIAGILDEEDGQGEWVEQWLPNGNSFTTQISSNHRDLVNVPQATIRFHNVYPEDDDAGGYDIFSGYATLEAALEGAISTDRIGTIKITVVDGKLADVELVESAL